MPDITVIVPTYNALSTLGDALRSIAASDYDRARYEVIVIDDGSTDATEAFVREYAASEPTLHLRYLKRDRSKGFGPGYARQDGIQAATGRIIACTDADCIVDRDWLAQVAAALAPGKLALACGETWCEDTVIFPWKMSPAGQKWITANLAFERELGVRTGFSHDFVGFNGDDSDFVFRMTYTGAAHAYVPAMRVQHPVRNMTITQVLRRSVWRSNDVLLIVRHGIKAYDAISPVFRPVLFGAVSVATAVFAVVVSAFAYGVLTLNVRLLLALGACAVLLALAFLFGLYRRCIMYMPTPPKPVTWPERFKTLVAATLYIPFFVAARIRGSLAYRRFTL